MPINRFAFIWIDKPIRDLIGIRADWRYTFVGNGAIPTNVWILTQENNLAPTVVNREFKAIGIDVSAFYFKYVVESIAIGAKSIGNVQRSVFKDIQNTRDLIGAALVIAYHQLKSLITACIARYGKKRILQSARLYGSACCGVGPVPEIYLPYRLINHLNFGHAEFE